jgi:hypothetical protein
VSAVQDELPAGLHPLLTRFTGGTGPTLAQLRLTDDESTDRAALDGPDLHHLLNPVATLRDIPGPSPTDVTDHIGNLATHLGGRRRTLLAVLLRPDLLLAALARRHGGAEANPDDVWLRCCWTVEAAWQVVQIADTADETFAAGDLSLLWPVAARQRFLVLVEPLRRPHDWPVDDRYGRGGGLPERVFGNDTRHDMIGRCRQARWTWQRCLDRYQDHPPLASAPSGQLEAEHDLLLFCDGPATAPLVLSWEAVGGQARCTPSDQATVDDVIERHLLPRFRVLRVRRLAAGHGGAAAGRVSTAVLVTAATALVFAGAGQFRAAAVVAGVCYLTLGAGVVRYGRAWAAGWLLRLPAAAALGLAVLTTLHPDWWHTSPAGWPAALVLVAASYGYLAVEARNHGVAARPAIVRALGVTGIGLAHALLVCLLGLVVVVPEYSEQGPTLAALWRADRWPPTTGWAVLASGTAWCLAVGVFSQILWDDRPITAPLAHLQWRKGR